jgi:hypothetical protein
MAHIKTEIMLDNGKRIIVEKEVSEGDFSNFTGIENFTTELKRSICLIDKMPIEPLPHFLLQ